MLVPPVLPAFPPQTTMSGTLTWLRGKSKPTPEDALALAIKELDTGLQKVLMLIMAKAKASGREIDAKMLILAAREAQRERMLLKNLEDGNAKVAQIAAEEAKVEADMAKLQADLEAKMAKLEAKKAKLQSRKEVEEDVVLNTKRTMIQRAAV